VAKAITENTLFYGDNLDILRDYLIDECVDLIYLDPPFNSSRNYNVLFKDEHGVDSEAQIIAFEDTWHWTVTTEHAYYQLVHYGPDNVAGIMEALRRAIGTNQMMAYITMMTSRLIELHRVLKPTGSLYLHCDPTASHYLKVISDNIFGPQNFRNEIVWRRTTAHGPQRSFGPIHDTILFYTKTGDYFFQVVKRPYMRKHVVERYIKDESGRYKFHRGGNMLTGAGTTQGESGSPWRGFNPSAKNRHWAIPGFLTEQMPPEFEKLGVLAKLDALYDAGLIEIRDGLAWPQPLRYLQSDDGQPLQDIWAYQPYTEDTVYGTNEGIDHDVSWLGPIDPERLGYQTQKPLGLLERIIKSSCPKEGVILDPFCGCGTAIAAAQKLGRKWIGIDITHLSIALQKYRLGAMFPGFTFKVIGEPEDVGSALQLARDDRYQFQWWALSLVRAKPLRGQEGSKTGKKGSDKGIDGIINFVDDATGKGKRVIVQVKSGHVKSGDIRDLVGTVQREQAAIGVFITLELPTKDMKTEATSAGFYHSLGWGKEYPRIQILSIAELLQGVEVKMPPQHGTFKSAQRVQKTEAQQNSLDFSKENVETIS
jgi:site-specific DNA-methyltransferase (adenine-specific)